MKTLNAMRASRCPLSASAIPARATDLRTIGQELGVPAYALALDERLREKEFGILDRCTGRGHRRAASSSAWFYRVPGPK
ncbi:hypothetical protein ABWU93_16950 [Xanthomonas translucens pv. translucens]|uniref:hypothetical protein n=1 Tax=Xanthomonas campestris pv. translucens TaxID=343 RepID=UPI001F1A6C16|nr:hypothetical protein [Xanthomonas translucens]UII63666.1 hypothetical protein LV507_17435 [Xanthomonas translucens]